MSVRLLNTEELQEKLGLRSTRALTNLRQENADFPAWISVGANAKPENLRWQEHEVDEWIKRQFKVQHPEQGT